MKKHIFSFALMLTTLMTVCKVMGQDDLDAINISNEAVPQIDYQQYLSKKDKEDILATKTKAILIEALKKKKRINTSQSTLQKSENNQSFPKIISVGDEESFVSIPVSFSFTQETSDIVDAKDGQLFSQKNIQVVASGGNITCSDLSALTPHPGEEFKNLPDVPKAKAEGKCQYEHVFGEPPPYIDFELRQIMIQTRVTSEFGDEFLEQGPVFVSQYSAVHPKRGLSVQWFQNGANRTGTQVFGRCPPFQRADEFSHNFEIYVTAPVGWSYNGPVPFATAPFIRTNFVRC
jgi:hypothetical protein